MYPQVFGKYVLERELSRGGMARVLLATLRGAGGFEKKLVVKQIRDELAYDSQFVRRFVEEAKTTVALSHPNIVPVYELGVEAGTYFLAMELVEGLSIAELLRERDEKGQKRVLTPEEGAYVGAEVCRALDYAHRRMKVVHRDITPRNVMLDEEGQVKLIDFGIAAPARVAGHEILGSPGHMPPEQVDGKELGPGTDLFAVAVLLMEAWSGIATFRRATPEECDAAMREPHPKPSDYDPRLIPLDEIITSCLALDPAARPKDANELGRALRNFLQGIDIDDIARDLGERVRDMREAASSPSPPAQQMSMRPSQASHGDLGTKTFAAREEALRWSSPPPADAPVPSTRRLPEADPMMSIPTPLMIEPLEKLETIATRPLETPVRPSESKAPSERPKRTSRGWAIGLVAVAAVSGFAIWKVKGAPEQGPRPSATSTSPTTTPTAPSATVSTTPSGTTAPPVSATAAPTSVTTAPPSAATGTTNIVGRGASVLLLGEPGTKVSIDGAGARPCPIRLTLDPGPHEARFTFDPTGESRGERISLKPGDKLTVRADFTGATPTVTIFR